MFRSAERAAELERGLSEPPPEAASEVTWIRESATDCDFGHGKIEQLCVAQHFAGPPETQSMLTVSPDAKVATGFSPASKNPQWQCSGRHDTV